MLAALLCLMVLAVWSYRYAWWRPTVPWRHPRILMYHMVAPHRPGARFNGLRVPPELFEAQLARLKGEGWRFFTISELWAQWDDLPAKSVAITFDDGFRDNLTTVLPLLERYDARATVYVVVDRLDRDWSTAKKAHHDSGELMREAKLSDAEIRLLAASGRVEIGSHTLTHCYLPTTPREEKVREMAESRILLQESAGVPVTSFAYPFGAYGDEDAALAAAAGYETAVTTDPGIDRVMGRPDPYRLKRVKISGKEGLAAFSLRLRTGLRGVKP
jgi:peptidoglycan/xylan/chitin deacetylase (PgdA/CDA1 family)